MILVIVGTHHQPFTRAVCLAAELARIERCGLEVQHGHTPPIDGVEARWQRWYAPHELESSMDRARIVVVHGGSGCIFGALRRGVHPIVVPRLAAHGEHVDDHQLQLCSRLERSGEVVAWHGGDSAADVRARWREAGLRGFSRRPDLRPAVWEAARAPVT